MHEIVGDAEHHGIAWSRIGDLPHDVVRIRRSQFESSTFVSRFAEIHAHPNQPIYSRVRVPATEVPDAAHSIDATIKTSDGCAGGDAANEREQPAVIGEENEHRQNAVIGHAFLATDVTIFSVRAIVEGRRPDCAMNLIQQISTEETWQMHGVCRIEGFTQCPDLRWRFVTHQRSARQLNHCRPIIVIR